jgi:hypothetical protein
MSEFRNAIESGDLEGLLALMADDVVFRSPIVFKPYEGREAVGTLLRAVMRVFKDFRYEREIGAAGDADQALVFRTRVDDREIEGCDFLHFNEAGLIDEFFVMVRPLSGAHALAGAMQQELAA